MARIVRNLAVLMAMSMLVAGAGVAALPAVSASASTAAALPAASASASTAVEAFFSDDGTGVQLCSDPGTFFYSGSVVEVYNVVPAM
jgi:hypothetical protein